MKRLITLLLAVFAVLSVTACGNGAKVVAFLFHRRRRDLLGECPVSSIGKRFYRCIKSLTEQNKNDLKHCDKDEQSYKNKKRIL